MVTRNSRSVASALPASWVDIGYMMERRVNRWRKEWSNGQRSGSLQDLPKGAKDTHRRAVVLETMAAAEIEDITQKGGLVNFSDEFHNGHLSTAVNNKNIYAVRHMIETDKHMNYDEFRASLGIEPAVTVEENVGVSTDNFSGSPADSRDFKIWTPEMGPLPLDRQDVSATKRRPGMRQQISPPSRTFDQRTS
ncbi:hypothetical protein EVAR_9839_1 [Eumeta japonica]|uniref:Uncharacterized protein n=1 Tax=Eumeta variegata TaxID=151549 RepID=A0A4C1TQ73_EUMVA|nr:hypothetical protein EVAR_9839_1 [Eumeta japonica]